MDGDGPEEDAIADGGRLIFDLELNFMGVEGFEEGMRMQRGRRKSSSIRGGGGGIRRGRSGRGVGVVIDAVACRGTTMVLLLLLT